MSEKKPSYWEMLRDPRWQKKRLEIMDRDQFRCTFCDEDSQTLNVHHSYYEKGMMPWEYPDYSLHTLCENCHEAAQVRLKILHRAIGMLSLPQIEHLAGYALGLSCSEPYGEEATLSTCEEVDGFVRAIMTHSGPDDFNSDAHRKFNAAADRVINVLRSNDCKINFRTAYETCLPPTREINEAVEEQFCAIESVWF